MYILVFSHQCVAVGVAVWNGQVTCGDAFSFFFCTKIEAIEEDLTEVELTTIADHVDPDILSRLSVRLHKNTQHYPLAQKHTALHGYDAPISTLIYQ